MLRIKWCLLTGLVAVCATTAKAMLLHVLKAKLVKVPNSRRVRGLSRWLRNFVWIAQYSPCRVHAIRSMPSSGEEGLAVCECQRAPHAMSRRVEARFDIPARFEDRVASVAQTRCLSRYSKAFLCAPKNRPKTCRSR